MQLEYMSSEESDLDDDGEVLLLHPLTWRSEKVNRPHLRHHHAAARERAGLTLRTYGLHEGKESSLRLNTKRW